MKQLLLFLLSALFAVSACAQTGRINNDDGAAVRASEVTTQYRLTGIKTACLYFDTFDEGPDYLVRVREKHSKECGGDIETTQTVFFLKLRKSDGHATTSAYNLNGNFEELEPLVGRSSSSSH
jgi:hypothetical protein